MLGRLYQMRLNLLALLWAATSILVAFASAAQFLVTYAIPSDRPRERAIEDTQLMHDVVGGLAPASYVASGLLIANAILVLTLVLRRSGNLGAKPCESPVTSR
jgi:hypothetical protein